MSASRSVAAAQRRRAGPPEISNNRGPNTSINSSQAFSQPMRPGTTGRLAGQQAALNQQQQMQNLASQASSNSNSNLGTSKMTVPQAITLITLRLGRLETQMQNVEGLSLGDIDNDGTGTTSSNANNQIITNILERLDALEKKNGEVSAFKPALVSLKNVSNGTVKEIKELKEGFKTIKNELQLTKNLVEQLQGVLSNDDIIEESLENVQENIEEPIEQTMEDNNTEEIISAPVINLKDMIEQELNLEEN